MRIMVIGATGTIGREVVKLLAPAHDIVKVGNRRGDYCVDLGARPSIEKLFAEVGTVDAVVSVAGTAKFGSLDELSDEDYMLGLTNKLMGQVNLVRIGRRLVRDNGSLTLTSGILSREPMPGTAAIAMVNGALESFVRAAALEMQRGLRVNVVSPIFVKETMQAMGMDTAGGMSAARTARAYKEAVEGVRNGEVLDARAFV